MKTNYHKVNSAPNVLNNKPEVNKEVKEENIPVNEVEVSEEKSEAVDIQKVMLIYGLL